jgi:hypothetical protein
MVITEPGIYDAIPNADYQADPIPAGSLSCSGARTLLRSPAHYAHQREHGRPDTEAFDLGRAVHTRVLGVGDEIALCDFDSWRTKAAREAKDEARAEGKTPILVKDHAPIVAMAEAVLAHPLAKAILETPGKREQSLFAQDPQTKVWLRARLDHLPDPVDGRRTIAADLKTAISADPNEWARTAPAYGYDVQDPWYQELIRLTRGDPDTAFVFVNVEKDPPHLVSVVELAAEFPEIGRRKMRRAIDLYAECSRSGEWPGYAPIVHYVEPPRWYVYQDQEEVVTA